MNPLPNAPARVPLARLPTPLEPSRRLGAALGIDLWIKRDDLTGLELTGNKARKLEFLLAEAQAAGADTVVTCGGVQSNHCRATAFAAARLGMRARVLLRVPDPARPPPVEANTLLDTLVGAEIRYLSFDDYRSRIEFLERSAAELRGDGRKPYVIPEGGSNALGSWGYVLAAAELRDQLPATWGDEPVTLVCAVGSGGTLAGLAMGVRAIGWANARVLGFAVCNDARYFQSVAAAISREAHARWPELPELEPQAVEVDDGFVGPGYAQTTPEGLEIIAHAARTEAWLLDPVYTGKAMLGLAARARETPERFRRVVFLHTGGSFGLFPFAETILARFGGTPG